jgi:peroxiredoxin
VALAFDWTFPGRAEMVKSALDVLNVCAALPKAQAQFCETVDLPEVNKPVGINILLSAAEGEIVQVRYSFIKLASPIKKLLAIFVS